MHDVPATVVNELLALDNQICFALHSTARQLVRTYRPVLEELDLTHPQYLVMLVLWGWARERERHPTVKALGEKLLLDSGTLTPLLKRLQSRGLITRTRSSADEREVLVQLTRAGQALKKRAVRVPMTLLERSRMPLGELVELREGLKRLRSVLGPAAATAE
ncbi:MAG TPA: MarR family transcriptional regulator [Polyangiaceae bacterium]|jgi:DNA-binding MarR family transcriptional regulator|nr:MarR family transcriptional regulator [Polyangiaceae bacterium]